MVFLANGSLITIRNMLHISPFDMDIVAISVVLGSIVHLD